MPKAKKPKPYQLNPEPFKKWSPVDSTAIYEHIKEMASWCHRARSIMPRSDRYDLGGDLYNSAKAVMVMMRKEYRAPNFPEIKIRMLEMILDRVDDVIVNIQVAQDLNAISGQFFDIIASECRAVIEHATRLINSEHRRQLEIETAREAELRNRARDVAKSQSKMSPPRQNPPATTGQPASGGASTSSGRTAPNVGIGPQIF